MGHPAPPQNNDGRSSEPKMPTGLGWSEFFHELGRGPHVTVGGSPETGDGRPQERTLYSSESGDHWSLVRETNTGRVFVRHRPNLASGGQTSDMDIGEFLVRGGMGPEKQELLRLIGSAVEDPEVNT